MNKKKISFIVAIMLLLFAGGKVFAQSETDALNYSRTQLRGTARSVAMGGAFGALGGDLSGIAINPGGIAIYRSSEFSNTFAINYIDSKLYGETADITRLRMDQIGFVGYVPIRDEQVQRINFGFTYNRLKSFDREIRGAGRATGSIIDLIFNDYNNGVENGSISATNPDDDLLITDKNDPFDPRRAIPWLPIFGRNANLIYPHPDKVGKKMIPLEIGEDSYMKDFHMRERGYVDNYDFVAGASYMSWINFGFALAIQNVHYNLATAYSEGWKKGDYTLHNYLNVNGTGVGAKFGILLRPNQILRFGIAYHTPIYYSFSETFNADMRDDMSQYTGCKPGISYADQNDDFYNDYDFVVPGKCVFSAAAVLGQHFITSIDYEFTDYGKMKLKRSDDSYDIDWYDYVNDYIKDDFKLASTIRTGMEYRFSNNIYTRLGFAWIQNPYEKRIKELGNLDTAGSNTIFRLEGDDKYLTGGMGFRFSRNFFLDMAIVSHHRNDQLYAFPNVYDNITGKNIVYSEPTKLKNRDFRCLITFGYKF